MKTIEQIEKEIQATLSELSLEQVKYSQLLSPQNRGGDFSKIKALEKSIAKKKQEIARLKLFQRYVETVPEEGIKETFERINAMLTRIEESVAEISPKEAKAVYKKDHNYAMLKRQRKDLAWLLYE